MTLAANPRPAPAYHPVIPWLALPHGYTWRAWVAMWTIMIALQVLLLSNHAKLDSLIWRSTRWVMGDQNAYRWADYKAKHAGDPHAHFYQVKDPPYSHVNAKGRIEATFYQRTETFWRLARDLGEPIATLLVGIIVWLYHPRRWRAVALLASVTVTAGVASTLLRSLLGRFRPIVMDGDSVWQFYRGLHEHSNLSFPSGHATLSFATAAVLTYLSPRGYPIFLWVAGSCAISRVVMQAHFPSDVLAGATIGWTIGWFLTRTLDRRFGEPIVPLTPQPS